MNEIHGKERYQPHQSCMGYALSPLAESDTENRELTFSGIEQSYYYEGHEK